MNDVWSRRGILSPSLISCCDLCNLERCVQTLETAGIDMLHVDILDGRISRQDLAAYIPDGLADIFVAGSTCLNRQELAASAAALVQYRDTLL